MRNLLRRLIWCLAGLTAVLILAVIVIVWQAEFLLKTGLAAVLSHQLGAPVEIGEFHLRTRENAVEFRRLELFNPPGFGTNAWLTLSELYLAVDSSEGHSNNPIRWREIRVNLEELALVVNQQGKTNLLELGRRVRGASGNELDLTNWAENINLGGIDRLVVSIGRLKYQDLRDPTATQEVPFGMTNRVFTNLNSAADFQPLAAELMMRAAVGILTRPNGGPFPQLLQQWMRH